MTVAIDTCTVEYEHLLSTNHTNACRLTAVSVNPVQFSYRNMNTTAVISQETLACRVLKVCMQSKREIVSQGYFD